MPCNARRMGRVALKGKSELCRYTGVRVRLQSAEKLSRDAHVTLLFPVCTTERPIAVEKLTTS